MEASIPSCATDLFIGELDDGSEKTNIRTEKRVLIITEGMNQIRFASISKELQRRLVLQGKVRDIIVRAVVYI